MGEEIFGYRLDVHSIIDPNEMELGFLCDDYLAASDDLVGQGRDVRAVLFGD